MDKMRMESVDITDQNIDKISELFPSCITETMGENGKLKKAINFDMLRQLLSKDVAEGDEVYDFTWVGKKAALREANTPIRKTLRPEKERSVNWDTTENLYIEGDNLEALKLLQESYLGKVKMIYIDPPYNTGNDFIYEDDFRQSKERYDEDSGAVAENGDRMFKNTDSNGRFHSDWCSMIYSRLLLARNLLIDDGVMLISIDDNEQMNLRRICDEIFGAENLVSVLIWNTKNASKGVPPINMVTSIHEYILVYAKSKNRFKFRGFLRTTDDFSNPDNDPRGLWRKEALVSTISKKSFEIIDPKTGNRFFRPWAFSKESLEKMIKEDRVLFPPTEAGTPLQKKFFNDYTNDGIPITTQLGTYQTRKATSDLIRTFGGDKIFDFSKPISLIEYLINQCTSKDCENIVFDFFSGSATTAHAVMQLNAEDGGNRKFIMVQLPEKCDEKSEAYKAGYQNICEIGEERIRRAAKKIHEDNPDAKFDDGFRVFRIDDSSMTDIYYSAEQYNQNMLANLESNIKPDRTDLDLLFGCLLEWGLPLSMPHTSEDINGSHVHTYNDGDLIACFDENISEETIKTIASRKPLRAVFRDSSFKDSPSKINVAEIFKMQSPDTTIKVI